MKAKFVYEAMGDVLKGKSEEEILSSIEKGNLNSDNLLIKSTNVGFLPGVKKALEIGADVHVADDYALEWASRYGYKEIVELLLKHGANVHAKDDLAFRWASQNGYLATAKLLLKYMNIKESLVNIFKPKSQEEINRDLIELYGFIPSDEETLILAIDRGKMKPGDHPYPIEYHKDSIGVFWKKLPGQRPLSRLKSSEILWLLDIIDGKHEFDSQWIKGPKFK